MLLFYLEDGTLGDELRGAHFRDLYQRVNVPALFGEVTSLPREAERRDRRRSTSDQA